MQLLTDVWNADKHGYPLTKPSWSGKAPRLVDVAKALSLRTAGKGHAIEMVPGPAGLDVYGHGSPAVVYTGRIVDADGTLLATVPRVLEDAMRAWETLLQEWGLL